MQLGEASVRGLSGALGALDALAMLKAVHASVGKRAAILSSMQRAGTVLCHLADRAGLDFDVLFVDTGVLHQETLATRDRLALSHPHLRVRSLMPARSFEQQTRDEGLLYLSKEGQERCCDLRKSEPLAAIKGQYDVLIGALRRGEGGARSKVRAVAADPALRVLRVHPFVNWSAEDLSRYVAEHPDVALNPLHLMGFPTIGCFPCTTPVRPDEDERAGRWRHLADVAYCGINPTDRAHADASLQIAARGADGVKKLFDSQAIPLR
jgi:phosphoadenosine phosphosulfate reductase